MHACRGEPYCRAKPALILGLGALPWDPSQYSGLVTSPGDVVSQCKMGASVPVFANAATCQISLHRGTVHHLRSCCDPLLSVVHHCSRVIVCANCPLPRNGVIH